MIPTNDLFDSRSSPRILPISLLMVCAIVDGRSPLCLGMLGSLHFLQPQSSGNSRVATLFVLSKVCRYYLDGCQHPFSLSLDLACTVPGSITILFSIRLCQDFARFLWCCIVLDWIGWHVTRHHLTELLSPEACWIVGTYRISQFCWI